VNTDELPEGWELAPLGSLFKVQTGGTPDRKKPEYYTHGTIPWVRTTEVQNCDIHDTGEKITQAGLENSSAKLFPASTLLIALYGEGKTRGQVARLKIAAATNQACSALVNPDLPETSNRYVFYCLLADYHRLRGESAGGNQPNLSNGIIKSWEIPLPPLVEQWRIVAAVERVLGAVTAARARLDRVPTTLKRFRQAVLAAACSGRLTADWRVKHNPDAKPSSNEDLPSGWELRPLADITDNFDGKRVPVKSDDRAKRHGPYPYYGASGVIDQIDDFLFDGEFLLIGEDGANLLSRSTPLAFQASGKFWVNNHAHILQTRNGMPLAYLELFINGFDLQEFVTGSAQPKLTQAAMNRIPVPVPPLAEQQEIVKRVSALFARANAIEAAVSAARKRVDAITQAVLAKAFRGELVPTEAELARRENRPYEPAADLLARVRASATTPAAKPKRTRKPKGNATP
jgi:restriction endonuclease S subunit